MYRNLKRAAVIAAALAVPMTLGIGGIASAATHETHTSINQTSNYSNNQQSTVYFSQGSWWLHGWHEGRYYDSLNLTILLHLGDRSSGWDGGSYGYGGGLLGLL